MSASLAGGCGGTPAPPSGRQLFATDCAACHSLRGDESARKSGGDLLGYRFGRAVWVEYAREMPVRRALSPDEVGRVVDYVLAVQRAPGR